MWPNQALVEAVRSQSDSLDRVLFVLYVVCGKCKSLL